MRIARARQTRAMKTANEELVRATSDALLSAEREEAATRESVAARV